MEEETGERKKGSNKQRRPTSTTIGRETLRIEAALFHLIQNCGPLSCRNKLFLRLAWSNASKRQYKSVSTLSLFCSSARRLAVGQFCFRLLLCRVATRNSSPCGALACEAHCVRIASLALLGPRPAASELDSRMPLLFFLSRPPPPCALGRKKVLFRFLFFHFSLFPLLSLRVPLLAAAS